MIINGDALTILRRMDDESIHAIMTSSPYFNLRCYGTEPLIWDGDPNCNHEWGVVHPQGYRGNDSSPGPLQHEGNKNRQNFKSEFCSKCGAWRGELGMEPTPELFVQHITTICHELKRVLRSDGVFYYNIGDSYARDTQKGGSGTPTGRNGRGENYPGGGGIGNGLKAKDLIEIPSMIAASLRADGWYLRARLPWIKRNSLPSSVDDRPGSSIEYVFQLTKSGDSEFWTHPTLPGVRTSPAPDYVWHDRQMGSILNEEPHDWKKVLWVGPDGSLVLNKSKEPKKRFKRYNLWEGHDYYWDYVAVMQHSSESYNKDKRPRGVIRQRVNKNSKYPDEGQFERIKSVKSPDELKQAGVAYLPSGENGAIILEPSEIVEEKLRKQDMTGNPTTTGFNERWAENGKQSDTRFLRDSDFFLKTWQGLMLNEDGEPLALVINPKPYKGAHFACFPVSLIEPLIVSSTSEKGCCPICGAPWHRVIDKRKIHYRPTEGSEDQKHKQQPEASGGLADVGGHMCVAVETIGWQPTCSCGCKEEDLVPAIVLDPFAGSSATGVACKQHNRTYIGIELKPDYCKLGNDRIKSGQ